VVGVIGALSFSGLNSTIIQSVARGFGGSLRQAFKINLKWGVGVLFASIAIGVYYFVNDNYVLGYSFVLAGILSPITTGSSLYGAYLLGKKDFRRNSVYSVVRNIAPATLIIIALLVTQNLPIIITVYFLVGALVPLYFYRRTLRAYLRENDKEDPELLSYSGHLSIMDIIGTIAGQLDKILIFHYLGAAPLALYAFAIAPVEQLQGGKKILSTLILPRVSERPFEELQASAPRKALLLTVYALTLAGIYILVAPYFYSFFFPQYIDSVIYSQVYSLTLLAVSGTVFNETLLAHKKKKELYVHRVVVPMVQISLFLVLLPSLGLMGFIITHVIIRPFAALVSYYFVMRPFKSSASS
jgi:O-antigen/teichoic acid export membrane protein